MAVDAPPHSSPFPGEPTRAGHAGTAVPPGADPGAARRSLRRTRLRRWSHGVHAAFATLLAVTLCGLVNALSFRLFLRWDVAAGAPHRLSERTRSLLASLKGNLRITAFLTANHPLREQIRNLLHEYEYAVSGRRDLRLEVRFVDPDRDLAWVRDMAHEYHIDEPNLIVFDYQGRRHTVAADSLAEYMYETDGRQWSRRPTGFRGEERFSSALLSVVQSDVPVVYFLRGHGEHDPEDVHRQDGYSRMATLLQRDNLEVRPLLLPEFQRVPSDAAALVIAGPRYPLVDAEVDLVREYLARGGRLLLLVDAGTVSGLEPLLAEWGLTLTGDRVVDPVRTLTGREVFAIPTPQHPIARAVGQAACVFFAPQAIEVLSPQPQGEEHRADRARVAVLVWSSPQSWRESAPTRSPPRSEAPGDLRGPYPLAVAAEKGLQTGDAVGLPPARLVVVGDSDFAGNGALSQGLQANADFLLGTVNWLIAREMLLAIPPRPCPELRLSLTRSQWRTASALVVLGPAVAVGLAGWAVSWRRRH